MWRKLIPFVAVAFVAAQLACASGTSEHGSQAQTAKVIKIKYAHLGVPGAVIARFADQWAKEVNQQTNGAVQVTVYGNAQLGNIDETIDGVKNGTIGMAMHDFASLAKFVPNLAVFDAPFIYKDAAQSMRAADPYSSPVMEKLNNELIQKAGIRIIANCYRGARELTSKVPVYSPADMKGKKYRGVPLPLWMSMLKGMGAIPTPVQYSELATSIATGVVVGQENPLNNIWSSKLYEVQPYIMMTNHMQSIQTVFMNEKVWESLSPAEQKIVVNVSKQMGQVSLKWTLSERSKLIKELKGKGIKFITPANGLKINEFRQDVLKQINHDYPQWTGLIKQIQAIK